MWETIQNIAARLRVKWHVVAVAFVTAVPVLLDQLHYINLRPILSLVLPEDMVDPVIGLMPFALMFLDNVMHQAHPEETDGKAT